MLINPRIVIKLLKCPRFSLLPHQLHRKNTKLFWTALANNVAGIPIKMPSLSPTMSEGAIVKWLKQEGDTVEPGDIICDIQTDKAVVSFEVEEEGILAKIMMAENSKEVAVGKLIALMVEPGEDWHAVEVPADAVEPTFEVSPSPVTSTVSDTLPPPPPHTVSIPSSVGPAVRSLLQMYAVDAAQVTATGPHGRLLKGDVLSFVAASRLAPAQRAPAPEAGPPPPVVPVSAPAAAPTVPVSPAVAPPSPPSGQNFIDLPLSGMRKTIAKRLTQSKTQIPHAYAQCEVPIDRLLAARQRLKTDGVRASLNDYVVKAVALSLRLHPQVNCVWRGEQLERAADVDVAIAVATDAGLITPIVIGAADRSVADIAQCARELAGRARAGTLRTHEFVGGSFTISNLGMLGVHQFSAIINPPQCGILAVGSGCTLFDADGQPHTRLTCTLSYDARAVGEQRAAAFLETLTALLTSPELLLSGAGRPQLADQL